MNKKKTDPKEIRPELAEVIARHKITQDSEHPEAVAKRRKIGLRTVRENVADLLDKDSSIEYGSLALAAQRSRIPMEDLIKRSRADGMVAEIGSVNGDLFDRSRTRCMVLGYDYTVLAGTQGYFNHKKKLS